MQAGPKLSYIVLSYNYRHHIGETLKSIFDQTVNDFEIIIVDDGSGDGSPEFIKSFHDPRIKLYVNDANLGGAASYNRAVSLASGEFLVNLDADDCVAPDKAEKQLLVFAADPSIDIVGTYINVINSTSCRHENADAIENSVNKPLNLNAIESWVVQNSLCRSSTMMRREAHMRIGLDEPSMVYACDFELWTRAVKQGCRFTIIPEKLTSYRVHSENITHKNTKDQLIEIIYLIRKNIIPVIEATGSRSLYTNIIDWIVDHNQFAGFSTKQRNRMIGSILVDLGAMDFDGFRRRILSQEDAAVEFSGRTLHALTRYSSSRLSELAHFVDVQNYEKAKSEWFIPRISSLEAETARLAGLLNESQAQVRAMDDAKTTWFVPRIVGLEAEVTRLAGLLNESQAQVQALDDAKTSWFVPRIATVEAEVERLTALLIESQTQLRAMDDAKSSWFVPRIASIEAEIEGLNAQLNESKSRIGDPNLLELYEAELGRTQRRAEQADAAGEQVRKIQKVLLQPNSHSFVELCLDMLRCSDLFDEKWYMTLSGSVPEGMLPALHYLLNGASGAAPGPYFDAAWYLSQFPDVAAARANPLIHYLQYGRAEGRRIKNLFEDDVRLVAQSSLFDEEWYRSIVPEFPTEISAIIHYLTFGMSGVSPSQKFDAAWYLSHYPDVAEAGVNPLLHYIRDGQFEGRAIMPIS